MELATVNDESPCGDRGLDAVCPPVTLDGTDGEKWRRRESNPRPETFYRDSNASDALLDARTRPDGRQRDNYAKGISSDFLDSVVNSLSPF